VTAKLPSLSRLAVLGVAAAIVIGTLALVTRTPQPATPASRALAPAPSDGRGPASLAALQLAARSAPGSAPAQTALAQAYLQRVRETGDASYYAKADRLLTRARSLRPGDPGVLAVSGTLALARHDFAGALRDGQAAHRAAPASAYPYGILVDSLVELGRYREAIAALQRMIDLQPSLAAYARVSYVRELSGDLDGAARAMRLAVAAGAGAAGENVAYVQTLLGDIELRRGRPAAAQHDYRAALASFPRHVAAQAGLARVDLARGRLPEAIARLQRVVERLPLPEYLVSLGEAQLAAGRTADGRATLAVVRAQERLLAQSGVDTDVDLALFEAEHGDPAHAVTLARAGWKAAPSVRSADALAAALTADGRGKEALPWARRALRLGWREPAVLEHAGRAAAAAGEPRLARRWLREALQRSDALSPWRVSRAQRLLERL
jgi:pentatricopeptide repeat protein